jgi:serine/threonine protein kinase
MREAFTRFQHLLELPAAQRTQTLADLKNTQPELYAEVATLLRAAAEASAVHFMDDGPLIRVLAEDGATALHAGDRLGHYEVDVPLGSGGMGEVWRARRTDGAYDAWVALKALHPHLALGTIRDRFAREGRILGGLSHPHIARLLDAGISTQGVLYLVIEYVGGRRIDEWCNEGALDITARIGLFLQICDAVAYAHAQLIVHRDLKPSNILVSSSAQVKLLDFGVAKLVSRDVTDRSTGDLTRVGDRVLTPDYAAPEQFRGDAVSAATDVYSLGIVLYELLSGCKPHTERAPAHWSAQESVETRDYVSPSQRALRATAALQGRAANHRELWRTLRGDLDAIIGKAMRLPPGERYPDARALREDLERYLAHEPVQARAGARGYVWRRFIRRHWLPTAAAAAVFLALLLGIVGVAWQAHIARQEAHTAEVVQSFMENIFRANSTNQADPVRARQTTARELLDVGTSQIETALVDTPAAKLRVLHTLVNMYDELGVNDKALELQRKSVTIARGYLSADDPALAVILTQLGNAAERVDLHAESEPAYLEAEGILDRAHDYKSTARAGLESSLAFFYDDTDPAKALIHAKRGVQAWLAFGDSLGLVNALTGEAANYISLGDYAQARDAANDAQASAQRVGPAANEQLIQIQEWLGYAEAGLEHVDAAELHFKNALQIASSGAGDKVLDQLEISGPLADFLFDTGRIAESLEVLRKGQATILSLSGVEAQSSRPIRTTMRYGRALLATGQLEAGMQLLQQAERMMRALGDEPFIELSAQLFDAEALGQLEFGRYAEAGALLDEAAQLHRRAGETMTPFANRNVATRVALLIATGRLQDARGALRGFWTGPDMPPDARPRLQKALLEAQIEFESGHEAAAAELAARQRSYVVASPNRSYLPYWEMQASLIEGEALRLDHRAAEALPLLSRALQLANGIFDRQQSPALAAVQTAAANGALDQHDEPGARALVTAAKALQAVHPALGRQYREPLLKLEARLSASSGPAPGSGLGLGPHRGPRRGN